MSVLAARLLQIGDRRDDHLGIALLISIAVHAALLAVRFIAPAPPPPKEVTLEVTLLNVRGETPSLTPQVLAQHDFSGGGQAESGVASSPLPLTAADTPDQIVLAAMLRRQRELEAEQERLLALLEARQAAAATAGDARETGDAVAEEGEDELYQESVLVNAQIAALRERIERYNARPRQMFVGPSAQSAPQARYVEAWRQKIEALGTEHYPQDARGKIYGDLQLTVYIRRDGSLYKVEVDRPSHHAVLNQAALRIVQLAAPFPPLPPELARDTDILAITRTWHFTRDQLETHTP